MNHKLTAGLLFIGLFLCANAFANETAKQQYAVCSACHGIQGEGNVSMSAPALAAQHAWYIERQLTHFSNGLRGAHASDIQGKTMTPFARQLVDDEKRKAVAKYLEGLPQISVADSGKGNLMNGERYYQAKCGVCHGGKAQGNKAFNAPKLSGQTLSYLELQMANFKSGVRGYHKDDKLGRQMAMMSKVVSDADLPDILYYISEQQ